MTSASRYAIGDLAQLAGVSRRTVRYYVQEGLIPPPLGVGRGNHYGPVHLEQILRVKAMQDAGKTLDEIRRGPADRVALRATGPREAEQISPERSIWRRLTLAPGVELQIAGNVRLPPAGRLQELAEWCRLHLIPNTDPADEANDV
jgi:DNA-binding transcriptional MerR regulator